MLQEANESVYAIIVGAHFTEQEISLVLFSLSKMANMKVVVKGLVLKRKELRSVLLPTEAVINVKSA
jgi:hypothetical protein